MFLGRGQGLSFMRKTIIILYSVSAACSTCSRRLPHHKSNTRVCRSHFAERSVSCANIYSISSLPFPRWLERCHMCAARTDFCLLQPCGVASNLIKSNLWDSKIHCIFFLPFTFVFASGRLGSSTVFTFRQSKFAQIYSGNHAPLYPECLSRSHSTYKLQCTSSHGSWVAA